MHPAVRQFLLMGGRPELVTNPGPFATTSGWTNIGTAASHAVVDGWIEITRGSTTTYDFQRIDTVAGATYLCTVQVAPGTASVEVRIGSSQGGAELYDGPSLAVETSYTFTFTASSTTSFLRVLVVGTVQGATSKFRRFSVKRSG